MDVAKLEGVRRDAFRIRITRSAAEQLHSCARPSSRTRSQASNLGGAHFSPLPFSLSLSLIIMCVKFGSIAYVCERLAINRKSNQPCKGANRPFEMAGVSFKRKYTRRRSVTRSYSLEREREKHGKKGMGGWVWVDVSVLTCFIGRPPSPYPPAPLYLPPCPCPC